MANCTNSVSVIEEVPVGGVGWEGGSWFKPNQLSWEGYGYFLEHHNDLQNSNFKTHGIPSYVNDPFSWFNLLPDFPTPSSHLLLLITTFIGTT